MSRRIHADTHGFRILFAPINRIFICSPFADTISQFTGTTDSPPPPDPMYQVTVVEIWR